MSFFKSKEKKTKNAEKKKKTKDELKEEKPVVKTKTKIGFRRRKEKKPKKQKIKEEKFVEEKKKEEIRDALPEFEEPEIIAEIEKEKPAVEKKKKQLIKTDMKNKPVFLEDTGEKLGVVFDTIWDKDGNAVGYKIKDQSSDSILTFSLDQFDYNKEGLIFMPGWYTNALKIIEKLEFKDKVSPDLTALLSDDAVSNEELYDIFVKYDDEMVQYIDDAKSLREILTRRLGVLEKQRLAMKEDLMDLTEKRLIKDIDRRQFSEDVVEHRRKVNILDLNINKCKELVKRLDKTSFGVLGQKTASPTKHAKIEKNLYERIIGNDDTGKINEKYDVKKEEDPYKEKYLTLKAQFEQLEEDYQELKIAVDRLVSKD